MRKLLIPFTLIFTFTSVLLFSNFQVNAQTKSITRRVSYASFQSDVTIYYDIEIDNKDEPFTFWFTNTNFDTLIINKFKVNGYDQTPNHDDIVSINIDFNGNSRSITIEGVHMSYSQYNVYVPFDTPIVITQNYYNANPVLDGETAFVTNVDSPMSELEIRSHITAFDNEDGDITNKIILENDEYTPNKNKVGEYTILYSVTDEAGNRAELTVHVLVRDVTKPVITGKSSYTTSMTTLFDVSTIINDLSVTDNYDKDLVITISSDDYTKNYNKLGTYNVIFKATDSSNNTDYYTVKITVIDDVKPVINGPSKIVKGTKEILTVSDIKSQLTASDNVDGSITDRIEVVEDLYTGNGDRVGTYTIKFKVSDKSGNETEKIVTIEVIDDIPPVFFVDNYFITVNEAISLTTEDIIDLLVKTGQFTVDSQTTVMTVLDEYTGNERIAGMYAMTFRIKSVNGNESEHSVVINVINDETDDIINLDPIEEDSSIWDYIVNFFKWLWNAILWLFKKIGHFFKSLF